eukprot:c18831_g1_i1 orf=472-1998(+)
MSRIWLCIAVAAVSLPVAFLVDHIVPDPYMDEIFHIPQMKQYCKGNFRSWDPMITTPPGLYLVTYIYTSILSFGGAALEGAIFWSGTCSIAVLRHVNVLFSIICAVLFREITLHLEPDKGAIVASLKAFALSCYPLHWFFTFLFYTDVGSTTAVLAMYLACLKQAYWTSSLLGLVAILFRQTNVIWTFFVACVGIIDFLFRQGSSALDLPPTEDQPSIMLDRKAYRPNLKHRSIKNDATNQVHSTRKQKNRVKEDEVLVEEILFVLQQAWQMKSALIWRFLPMMLPILCFLVFVAYNGSIVLGAKEAHKASPHFAQVLYFGVAAVLAMAPVHLNSSIIGENFRRLSGSMQVRLSGYLVASIFGALACIHFFSFAHPYLVSDNRHYTFYIWRRVINVHWSSKYLLSIIYVYSWCSIFTVLGKSERKIWLLIFFGAVVAVLVPAPLIEFRYYTVPFYFIALHTPIRTQKDYLSWVLIFLQYSATNFVTMYMFLYKPFFRPGEREAQRFLW